MSLQFASLGSGSSGNATVVRIKDTVLLVDTGFSAKAITERLATLDLTPSDLTAILISHEHSDHIKGLSCWLANMSSPYI